MLAAIDIGSNTVLGLTVWETATGLDTVREYGATPRLGEGLNHSGRLNPEAMGRTLEAIARILGEVRHDVPTGEPVRCFVSATSAVRCANNQCEFLELFQKRFGFLPRILSGEEEARCSFSGAVAAETVPGPFVTIDIGGGSTEICLGTPAACQFARSTEIGCVRLTETFGLDHPVGLGPIEAARLSVRQQLGPVCAEISRRLAGQPFQVLGTDGTASAFAHWMLDLQTYNRPATHGFIAARQRLHDAAAEIGALDTETRIRITHAETRRASVFPAGLIILSEILAMLDAANCKVTAHGLRHGMILKMLAEGETTIF
jgi:exopolyphosphatase/guanosine-5'-triphosphate,3'-diphosphate pyrophosphatase